MATEYSKEFKEEALKLTDEIGIVATADKLRVVYNTLSNWRCKRKRYGKNSIVGSGHMRIELGHERKAQLEKKRTPI